MTDKLRPAWERLLTDDERAVLDSVEKYSEWKSETRVGLSCDYCKTTMGWDFPLPILDASLRQLQAKRLMRHADDCPTKIARLFARCLAGARGRQQRH